MKKIYSKYSI